jgi:putative sporulation protein YyaC
MVAAKVHYLDQSARTILSEALTAGLGNVEDRPVFICIGSDRHLLDSFGPLTGTMLQNCAPGLPVYGTLDNPLHAQNLLQGLKEARQQHFGKIMVAIDASVGREEEIGWLQICQGGLVPGKAMARNLPTVGQMAITGVVDVRFGQRGLRPTKHPGLALVYNMAELLSNTIGEWYKHRYPA